MQKKLTIMIDERVYEGLHAVVGRRRISRFIEALVQPYVVGKDLDVAYRQMAQEETREAEALVSFCHSRKIKLMDGFFWPHHPRTAQMKKLLTSGKLGRVERVTGAFTFKIKMDPTVFRLQETMGGGSLWRKLNWNFPVATNRT